MVLGTTSDNTEQSYTVETIGSLYKSFSLNSAGHRMDRFLEMQRTPIPLKMLTHDD